MASKDPLQSSINKLDNTMNALNKTVKGLTKAFTDMNRTETSRKTSPVGGNKKLDDLKNALLKVAPLTKQGTPRKDYERTIEQLIKVNTDSIEKYNKILEFGYNKDNPSNKLKDVYGIKEVQKLVDDILKTLENKKNGISKDDSKHVREDLYGNVKGVSVDSSYKLIQAMNGGSEAVLRTAGVFAQTRSEVVAFQSAIKQATKTVVNNLSGSSKKVNDRLSKMAADSKILKNVVSNLNHNVTRANRAIEKFTDRLNTASALITSNNRGMRGSATSINTLIKKIQKTSNTITNIQNSLSKKNSGSSTSAKSSFREQATRNSDRAKQAGFIALLIPALAKLLKKTPITDYFKLLALRFGAGPSGTGEHPFAGALGLMAAPTVSAALFSGIFRKQFGALGSKVFGVSEILKSSNVPTNVLKGLRGIPFKNWGKYIRGISEGLSAPKNTFGRQQLLIQKGYATAVPGTAYRDPMNRMRWLHKLQPIQGEIAGYQGVKVGQNLQRLFTKVNSRVLGGNALGKSPISAALSKGALKRIPAIGALINTAFEIPDLIKAASSGKPGEFKKQLGKSTGGAAGGTAGAIAGGILGSALGPIGTIAGSMLGGMVGDIIGRVIGPALFDGLGAFTKNIGKDFKGMWKGIKDTFNGLGKIITPIAKLIGRGLVPVFKLLGLVVGGAIKTVAWTLNIIARAIGKTVDFIGNIVQKIAEGFQWLGEQLLSAPIIGPILRKMFVTNADDNNENKGNYGPDTVKVTENVNKEIAKDTNKLKKDNAKIDKQLKNYADPNSTEYKRKHGEFVTQYIRANTARHQVLNTEQDAKLKADANAWAARKMKDEKYKLDVQKKQNLNNIASAQNAIGAALPSNLATTKVNGVNAVAMKDLGLQGAISKNNSVPYIASNNAQNLKNLDNYLTAKGYKFTYTSAMGGSHAGGARSHGAGQKVDLVLNQGGRLSKEDEKWLMKNGFIGNGAIGYHNAGSGYHYDLSVSGGKGLTEAQMAEYEKTVAAKNGTQMATATTTATKEETASSEIRSGLADIVGAKNKSDKQEKARNIIFSAVDVTGSLGVWGITQLNNGVMRTGR